MKGLIGFATFVGLMLWLMVMAAGDALAGDVYMYTTVDNVQSFTDDPRMIPAMYKPVAKVATVNGMADYPKLTTADRAQRNYRLDYLRHSNMQAYFWRYHPGIARSQGGGCR